MTNWEANKEKILQLNVSNCNFGVAARTGVVVPCEAFECSNCLFKKYSECAVARFKWLTEEYTEPKKPKIDWSKVPVDAPVLVWDSSPLKTERGHFANYESGFIYVWSKLYATSWMAKNDKKRAVPFLHGEIAPGIDCSKWYKE